MKLNRLLTSFLLLSLCHHSFGQELRCQVTVNADQVQYTNKRLFKTLETALTDFVNNKSWTNDKFEPDERIECAILLTIQNFTAPDQFSGSIQVSSNRPVFASGYGSTLLNYRDQDFSFTYLENAPLEFTPDQFRNNLTSVVAYYIYVILGMDYDSFSLEGGTPYYQEAQRIVSNAQNTAFPGWAGNEKPKNRFWIVDNILQTSFLPLRTAMYNYHRLGLDVMSQQPDEGRKMILLALDEIKKVHAVKPLSFNVQLFFTAKVSELIGIFSNAPQEEKTQFIALMRVLDPVNSSRYNEVLK